MNHFNYRNGVLHAEAVDLFELAAAVGTPFYCYSTATLERHYRVFDQAFAGTDHAIFYSAKANSKLCASNRRSTAHVSMASPRTIRVTMPIPTVPSDEMLTV